MSDTQGKVNYYGRYSIKHISAEYADTHHFLCNIVCCIFNKVIKYRKSYQILFAIIIPATLLLRIEPYIQFEYRKPFLNAIAVFELVLFVFGLILIILESIKTYKNNKKQKEKSIEKTENSEEDCVK